MSGFGSGLTRVRSRGKASQASFTGGSRGRARPRSAGVVAQTIQAIYSHAEYKGAKGIVIHTVLKHT